MAARKPLTITDEQELAKLIELELIEASTPRVSFFLIVPKLLTLATILAANPSLATWKRALGDFFPDWQMGAIAATIWRKVHD